MANIIAYNDKFDINMLNKYVTKIKQCYNNKNLFICLRDKPCTNIILFHLQKQYINVT